MDRIRKWPKGKAFEISPEGQPFLSENDANDIIGAASPHDVDWIAIPLSRLTKTFFDLKTQLAGNFLQKMITYGFRVAIVGDVSKFVENSDALSAFVKESNRGSHVWFLPSMDDLEKRLS